MITWCVAYTKANNELLAKSNLLNQGFEVYLPRFKKLRRHARKSEEVLAPLFPRYLFVGVNLEKDLWRTINGTRGISYLLMVKEDLPARLPGQTINELKSQELSEGVVPINSLVAFTKGDKVRILKGLFEDQTAVFESLNDNCRVELLLNLLGKEIRFSIPHYNVEAL